MQEEYVKLLQDKLTNAHYQRLIEIPNPKLHRFVADSIKLCNPDSVFVSTDSEDDLVYIRGLSITNDEESPLSMAGHTIHFDGYYDQARDKAKTKYLLPVGSSLGNQLNSIEKVEGIEEVRSFLKDSMVGHEMLICFWCLGPTDSIFSIPCVQITDSAYVAHSESILYRPGYEQFKKIGASEDFFRFIHTAGEVENNLSVNVEKRRIYIDLKQDMVFRFIHRAGEVENNVSVNVDKRRIYIDLEENMVYSTNTQYAGNTIGLKKLALRLAIQKASREGWLAEHMFVMGVHGPGGRITYFTGAFPSACGKTSTSMIPGQTIIGDDIAYLRRGNGQMRCVNVEKGIFGIIRDVNSEGDPVIYEALAKPGEVIFSNVLIDDDLAPHWLGMGKKLPTQGTNHSGEWHKDKTDADGNEITASHKNARYCLNISDLSNRDSLLDEPEGVPVGGIIYGGRDSDTWVPVEQAFDWTEGIILKGASLESETTAATLGKEGVRTFNLMSNLDFLSIPLGQYIQNNLAFANGVEQPPMIFSVNYFLKDKDGKYFNGMADKKVWILWAELRVHGDVSAIETPTGLIPTYDDLAKLFHENLDIQYTQTDYNRQFTIRVPENLAKADRIENIYKTQVTDTPAIVFEVLDKQRKRLEQFLQEKGEYVSPLDL